MERVWWVTRTIVLTGNISARLADKNVASLFCRPPSSSSFYTNREKRSAIYECLDRCTRRRRYKTNFILPRLSRPNRARAAVYYSRDLRPFHYRRPLCALFRETIYG